MNNILNIERVFGKVTFDYHVFFGMCYQLSRDFFFQNPFYILALESGKEPVLMGFLKCSNFTQK